MNPKWTHAVLNGRTFNKIGINSDSVAKQHRNISIMSIDDITIKWYEIHNAYQVSLLGRCRMKLFDHFMVEIFFIYHSTISWSKYFPFDIIQPFHDQNNRFHKYV